MVWCEPSRMACIAEVFDGVEPPGSLHGNAALIANAPAMAAALSRIASAMGADPQVEPLTLAAQVEAYVRIGGESDPAAILALKEEVERLTEIVERRGDMLTKAADHLDTVGDAAGLSDLAVELGHAEIARLTAELAVAIRERDEARDRGLSDRSSNAGGRGPSNIERLGALLDAAGFTVTIDADAIRAGDPDGSPAIDAHTSTGGHRE